MQSRRLWKLALLALVLVVLGGTLVSMLPEMVRQVALKQIPKRTGRAVAIEDIDLNLFTGRLAVKKFRLAERNSSETFVEMERLDARVALSALLRRDIRLSELALAAPSIRVVRTGPSEFNFSDLLRSDRPASGPSRWTVTLDHLTLSRGTIRVRDQVVSPAAEWLAQDLGVDVAGMTTKRNAAPGRVTVHAKIDEAVLDVSAEPLRLDPPKGNVKVALDGFETRRVGPYIYAATPYRPRSGRLALALDATVDDNGNELTKATVSGTVNLDAVAMTQAGKNDPFVAASRIAVKVKEADAIRRTLTLSSVAIEGLDLKVRRDQQGVIDVLAMFTPKAPAAAAAPKAAGAPPRPVERRLFPVVEALAGGFAQIVVDRVTLAPTTAAFIDMSVKPTTTLALTKLQATVTNLTWPPKGPATLALSTGMPGGGTLDINGPVVPQPFDADLAFKLRDAPVTPYQAYIPVPAQLSGLASGDSRNRIVLKEGNTVLASKGSSWARNVEIRAPGASRPTISVERADLVGIDFDWPHHAVVAKAGFKRLDVQVERQADGSFDLPRLFAPPAAPPAASAAQDRKPTPQPSASPGPPRTEKPKSLLDTMRLDFKQLSVEQSSIRFLDQTTKPAVSQDMTQLEVTVNNINNRPGERANLSVQSVIGGDASLDVRGEVGSIGSPAFVDLVGELRSFKLPSVDPYSASNIGWTIKKGELQYKMHFKLEGDELHASNDVTVGRLQVAPSSGTDEVKHRIGLPLGLIVSLVKDGNGEIRANVPVTGSLNDPKFDLRDAIWTAVKNVLTNIVKAPFRAIGRLFSSGDKEGKEDTEGKGDKAETAARLEEPTVAPVTFAAGSSVIAPDMEQHLLRVADFLRRTPYVNVALSSTSSPADADALKAEAVTAHLREFQQQRRMKDGKRVVTAYFKQQLPGVKPPKSVEQQLAMLREREPVPEPALEELAQHRVDATRQRLVSADGIPAERLTVAEGKANRKPPTAQGAGRVEFTVVAGGG